MFEQQPQPALEAELARLFAAYREACPDPEPSLDFMPRLWERIEAQRSWTREWKRLTEVLVTAAVALSVLLAVVMTHREPAVSFYTNTYVEVLAANYAQEGPLDPEVIAAEQDAVR
ncbi:MAG: hypothetical protein RMI94_07555 [Bryobacterales bacterium]|nr:hypothetical protein [Bryobacteraceae bacterium]MDW8130390.1 hypothetical protein [Bryobacterales bacterium]